MPKHLCKKTEEDGVVISRASSRSGRHRFHVPGSQPRFTRILRVWVWLPQISIELLAVLAGNIKTVATTRGMVQGRRLVKVASSALREALPTRADAANLARRINSAKTTLMDPTLPRRAVTGLRNTAVAAKGAAPQVAQRIASAGRTTAGVLTDPQTPRRIVESTHDATRSGVRMTRDAINDPRGTYQAITEHVSNSTATITATSKSGLRHGMALLGCAAIVTMAMTGFNSNDAESDSQFTVATGTAAEKHAERGAERGEDPQAANEPDNEVAPEAEDAPQSDEPEAEEKDSKDEKESEKKEKTINTKPKSVKGLDKAQMANALAVIQVGEEMNVPKRGQAIALMTVMQETKFYNLASDKYPSSLKIDNEGVGSDHDSVGIFQQRPSMGWGSVKECMDVEYASTAFYSKLLKVKNWDDMKLTDAAQKVQGSAFPNAYAKWDKLAYALLDEIHQ